MTQEIAGVEIGLGLCIQDNNVFVWKSDRQACIICGRPADYIIPVGDAGADASGPLGAGEVNASAPAPLQEFWSPCPKCGESLKAQITPDSFTLVSTTPPVVPQEPGAGTSLPPAPAPPAPPAEPTASLAEPPADALAEHPRADDFVREPVEPTP